MLLCNDFYSRIRRIKPLVMNLPSIRHLLPPLTLCVITLTVFFIPRIPAPTSEIGLYDTCQQLVNQKPGEASELAIKWLKARPESFAARHCQAIATYAMGNYPVAAKELYDLAGDAKPLESSLAAHLFLQSAEAFRRSGDTSAAQDAVGKVLALEPRNPQAIEINTGISKETAPADIKPSAGKN